VRALHFSALAAVVALALGGCSRQPPPMQPAPPCIDLKGMPCAVEPGVRYSAPSLAGHHAGTHDRRSSAVRHKRPRRHVEDRGDRDRRGVTLRRPQPAPAPPPSVETSSTPPVKWMPLPAVEQPETRAAGNAPASPPASTSNATVQEQVAVATALAERITALSRLPAPNGKDLNKDLNKDQPAIAARSDASVAPAPSRLVAVLMVRPGVRAIAELRGRVVAMDERYVAAHDKVASAMALAGASDVQLMQGQGTAINRLTNGEVAAAIVALVVPEAADAFPEIAGFRIFRIPL
jgi:hypothetical protein